MSITRFFDHIGMPLQSARWSWGAQHDNIIVLRTWADQYDVRARTMDALYIQTLLDSSSPGLPERVRHLKAIWEGCIAAYAVTATAQDPTTDNRKITDFRDDLFPIEGIEVDEEGTIFVRCAPVITPGAFPQHAINHRTKGGSGAFPVDESQVADLSSVSFQEKIPHIRERLIRIAQNRSTVTYGEVMDRFALNFRTIYFALRVLGKECVAANEPIITSLVVNKTGRCSKGLEGEFGITDDATERQRCYAYWRDMEPQAATSAAAQDTEATDTDDSGGDEDNPSDADDRLARFMFVQTRPEQPAFRRAVFEAYDGRCAISGCDIPEALEAAHPHGRNWREGHNTAEDGILLRRDLHTLYDRELLDFSNGVVRFSERVVHHYTELEGAVVRPAVLSE